MITSFKQIGCTNYVGYTDKEGNKFMVTEKLYTTPVSLTFTPLDEYKESE